MRVALVLFVLLALATRDAAAQASRLGRGTLSTTIAANDSAAPGQGGTWELWLADSIVTAYHEGQAVARARFSVQDSTLRVVEAVSDPGDPCDGTDLRAGEYRLRFRDSVTVQLTTLHDACVPRAGILNGRAWKFAARKQAQ